MTIKLFSKNVFRLMQKEFAQNLTALLLPGIFHLPLAIAAFLRKAPLFLGPGLTIAALIAGAVLAIVYGLQGFAQESDKKTMDFILSRPISLPALIGVKLLFCTGVFTLWLTLFHSVIQLDLSGIPFATKLDLSWFGVILIMLNSMAFVAGLLTRGAERLVVTVVLTGLIAGLSYGIWQQCFDLMAARYLWFDIPPHIYFLVEQALPWLLLFISLWIPWVIVLWYLKGKPNPLRFTPFRPLVTLWGAALLLTYVAGLTLGPAIWPTGFENREGDWHPKAGVALTGAPAFSPGNRGGTSLYLTRIGGKPRRVYTGAKITAPRWSPEGNSVAFVNDGWIKIFRRGRAKPLVPGENPTWSKDGRMLAFTSIPEENKEEQQIFATRLTSEKPALLWTLNSGLLELLWDSEHQCLYGIHGDGNLYIIDLKEQSCEKIKVPSPVHLAMRQPRLTQVATGEILLCLAGEHEAHVYAFEPGHNELMLLESRTGREMATITQAFASPSGKGFLWPRIDGAYEYQGIIPTHHHDHPGHKHCGHHH